MTTLPGIKSPEFKAYLKLRICVNCHYVIWPHGIVNAGIHCAYDDMGHHMNSPACEHFKERPTK